MAKIKISRIKTAHSKNGRYNARLVIRQDGREEFKKNFTGTKKRQVEQAREEFIEDWLERYNIGESSMTVREYYESWIKLKTVENAAATVHTYKQIFKLYILPELGKEYLVDLTHSMMRNWVTDKALSRSPDIANRSRRTLYTMLESAILDGKILANPLARVKSVKQTKPEKIIYSEKELKILVKANQKTRYMNLIYFMLATGIRFPEVSALTWDDVTYFENPEKGKDVGQVRIIRNVTQIDKEMVVGEPKTNAAKRVIRFTEEVARILDLQRDQLRYECERKGYDNSLNLIFPNLNGGYATYNTVHTRLTKLNKELGIKHVTVHGLRHVYASVAINAGVDVVVLSKNLGHSSVAHTLKFYAHFFELSKRPANDFFDKFLQLQDEEEDAQELQEVA